MTPLALRDLSKELDETKSEVVTERNRRPGPRKAKAVTKRDLLTFRDEYVRNEGKERGWKKAASREFHITVETITARMR
jgi:hypothetical protein